MEFRSKCGRVQVEGGGGGEECIRVVMFSRKMYLRRDSSSGTDVTTRIIILYVNEFDMCTVESCM